MLDMKNAFAANGLTSLQSKDRCNILIRPHFPVHEKGVHKWNTLSCMPLGCAVHHVACTEQLQGHTGMGQVFTFARVG